jgi:hypothetical protein
MISELERYHASLPPKDLWTCGGDPSCKACQGLDKEAMKTAGYCFDCGGSVLNWEAVRKFEFDETDGSLEQRIRHPGCRFD